MNITSTVKRRAPRRRKIGQFPILIVEDNADQWLIIRSALSQRFPEVKPVWVNNKAQAIRYLENHAQNTDECPRLILVDLYLPRSEDGFELLEFTRQHHFNKKPPIIVLSESTADTDISKVYDLGVFSYIVKPTNYTEWLNCFNSIRRYWWELVTLPFYHQQYDS